MVQLVTDAPQVQDPNLNILLGSFQRNAGSFAGAVADGLTTGARVQGQVNRQRAAANASAIDDDLFRELASIAEPGAVEALQRQIRLDELKGRQTGTLQELTDARRTSAIRKAIARGVAPAIIDNTVQSRTQLRQLENSAIGAFSPEESKLEFLRRSAEDQNLQVIDGVPIVDMTESQLQAAMSRHFAREAKVKEIKDRAAVVTANETINTANAEASVRALVPMLMERGRDQLELMLQEVDQGTGAPLIPLTTLPARRGRTGQTVVDIKAMTPANRALVEDRLKATEDQVRGELFKEYGGRLTPDSLNRALAAFTDGTDRVRRLLDGTETIEAVDAQVRHAEAISRATVLDQNPEIVDAYILAEFIQPVVDAAGLEAVAIQQELAENVFAPLAKSSGMNARVSMMNNGILSPEQQAQLYSDMSEAVIDEIGSPNFRVNILSNMFEAMATGAVEDSALFQAMMPLLADPEAGAKLLDNMDNIQSNLVRSRITQGAVQYQEDFEASFAQRLANKLTSTGVLGSTAVSTDSPSNISGFRVAPRNVLADFVSSNIGRIDTINDLDTGLDVESLREQGLTDRQIEEVVAEFDVIINEFFPELDMMRKVETGLGIRVRTEAQRRRQLEAAREAAENQDVEISLSN